VSILIILAVSVTLQSPGTSEKNPSDQCHAIKREKQREKQREKEQRAAGLSGILSTRLLSRPRQDRPVETNAGIQEGEELASNIHLHKAPHPHIYSPYAHWAHAP
jgi:hypothetical protein